MARNHQIEIHVHEPSSPDAELCRLYWERDPKAAIRASFKHPITSLAAQFGIPGSEVGSRVRAASYATMPDRLCPSCGRPVLLYNRSDYESHAISPDLPCKACAFSHTLVLHEQWIDDYERAYRSRADHDPEDTRALERHLQHLRNKAARIRRDIELLPSSPTVPPSAHVKR
jgi:hypothetical protein